MIYITQLIYIHPGKEDVFHQFEDVAIPLIGKYNGRLMLRIRPENSSVIEIGSGIEKPYEVHLVSFDAEADLEAFMKDEERKKFLHLKEEAIRTVVLIKGQKM